MYVAGNSDLIAKMKKFEGTKIRQVKRENNIQKTILIVANDLAHFLCLNHVFGA